LFIGGKQVAIKLTVIKCPACGAKLPIEEGRTQMFCSYCGSNIMMTNENEHIVRHVDEAKVKQAEARKTVDLKRIEYAEKKQKAKEKRLKVKAILTLFIISVSILVSIICLIRSKSWEIKMLGTAGVGVFAITALVLIWAAGENCEEDDENEFGDSVYTPPYVSGYIGRSFIDAEEAFRKAGFVNIYCVSLHDLKKSLFNRQLAIQAENTVASIKINDTDISSAKRKHSPNAKVTISYHSFS
jgi:uncharacterized Zn finger protein (UPF0148 family)